MALSCEIEKKGGLIILINRAKLFDLNEILWIFHASHQPFFVANMAIYYESGGRNET